jgi:hypothetical protein
VRGVLGETNGRAKTSIGVPFVLYNCLTRSSSEIPNLLTVNATIGTL